MCLRHITVLLSCLNKRDGSEDKSSIDWFYTRALTVVCLVTHIQHNTYIEWGPSSMRRSIFNYWQFLHRWSWRYFLRWICYDCVLDEMRWGEMRWDERLGSIGFKDNTSSWRRYLKWELGDNHGRNWSTRNTSKHDSLGRGYSAVSHPVSLYCVYIYTHRWKRQIVRERPYHGFVITRNIDYLLKLVLCLPVHHCHIMRLQDTTPSTVS